MLLGAQAATQQSHSMPTTTGPAHDGALPAAAMPSVAVPVEGDGGPTDSVRCPNAGTSGRASLGSPSLGSPSLGSPSLRRTPDASTIVPLREGRYKVQFTASQSLVDMFNEARDLFQNQLPTGDLASIVQRALVLLTRSERNSSSRKPTSLGCRGLPNLTPPRTKLAPPRTRFALNPSRRNRIAGTSRIHFLRRARTKLAPPHAWFALNLSQQNRIPGVNLQTRIRGTSRLHCVAKSTLATLDVVAS